MSPNTPKLKKQAKNPAADLKDTAIQMIANDELSKDDISWLKNELDDILEQFGKYHSKHQDS